MKQKMLQNIVKCIFLSFFVSVTNCARILGVYPVPSISHQVVFRPVMKELARRGHEVTVITPFPENGEPIVNYTEIDVHEISMKYWKKEFARLIDISKGMDGCDLVQIGFALTNEVFEKQFNSKVVQDLLKNNAKFDLVFAEALSRPALIFAHIFNAPAIQFSSFLATHPNYPAHGSIGHLLIHAEMIRTKIYNLTLKDKFEQLYMEVKFRYLMWRSEETENAMLKRNFGPDAPTVQELMRRAELLFLNINPIFEGNRAVPPAVIHLGGLHQIPSKELPKDIKSYLDASKHGVIYMSFGSNVQTDQLPAEKIQAFCRVFSRLPYDVLWKWNADELHGKPDNVKISKWLPQSDLLRHPKIKLFITQGGLQSTDEAITAGVPLLTVPIFGDQAFNAEQHVRLKIAVRLNLLDIEEDILEKEIKRLINDPSFRQNLELLRERIMDQPQTPLERAIWWTEYLLRHKTAKHLRSPIADVSWYEFLMLDVVLTALAILVAMFYVLIRIVKFLFAIFSSSKKVKTS